MRSTVLRNLGQVEHRRSVCRIDNADLDQESCHDRPHRVLPEHLMAMLPPRRLKACKKAQGGSCSFQKFWTTNCEECSFLCGSQGAAKNSDSVATASLCYDVGQYSNMFVGTFLICIIPTGEHNRLRLLPKRASAKTSRSTSSEQTSCYQISIGFCGLLHSRQTALTAAFRSAGDPLWLVRHFTSWHSFHIPSECDCTHSTTLPILHRIYVQILRSQPCIIGYNALSAWI